MFVGDPGACGSIVNLIVRTILSAVRTISLEFCGSDGRSNSTLCIINHVPSHRPRFQQLQLIGCDK